MKKHLLKKQISLMGILLFTGYVQAQGFQTTASNWRVPMGGYYGSGGNWGFNAIGASASASGYISSHTWGVMDMDGDGKSDLVVCAQNDASGNDKAFSATANPYWKVYLNTGTGFSTTVTNWPLPAGGLIASNSLWSFNALSGNGSSTSYIDSQTWSTMDINGDQKPDLVVCAQKTSAGEDKAFSPTSNPYWKVYLNTGTGFSATATNWALPAGGRIAANSLWSFNDVAGSGSSTNYIDSQTWSTMDINGDQKPDLVVCAQKNSAGEDKAFSPTANAYWKVYFNTGTGFSTTATNWTLPAGGRIAANSFWSFNTISGNGSSTNYIDSQTWSTMDINGDQKPDLVVCAQKNSAGEDKTFSPTANAYWKVYLNSGTGFSTSATNWPLPAGGRIAANSLWSFNDVAGTATSSNYIDSQTWSTMDIDGDQKPDLLVHAQNNTAGDDKAFSPTGNAYWKAYLNNGTGFSTSATNWSLPAGGYIATNSLWSFNAIAGSATSSSYIDSQTWSTTDMNGDKKPDLVVHAVNDNSGNDKVFSPGSSPYWKVYLNTSTVGVKSFEDKATQDVIVYPNPSTGKFAFIFPGETSQVNVEIYNIMGEKVLQSDVSREIDLSNFPKGAYVAVISDGKTNFTKKLILQ